MKTSLKLTNAFARITRSIRNEMRSEVNKAQVRIDNTTTRVFLQVCQRVMDPIVPLTFNTFTIE